MAGTDHSAGRWAHGPLVQLLLLGLVLLAAGIGFAGLRELMRPGNNPFPGFESVVLLIAGFVTVTLLLYVGTIVLRALGLGTRREAMGMPEGSIRALIAMSLILIFAIIGILVFRSGGDGTIETSTGITRDDIRLLRDSGAEILDIDAAGVAPDGTEPVFDVRLRSPMPAAAHDFGLQLMTTVSTLVVAVAGFYFGSRSVSAATRALGGGRASTSVRIASPGSPHFVTDWSAPVDIEVVVEPAFVSVSPQLLGDETGRVDALGGGRYRYVPGAPAGDLVVVTFTAAAPYSASADLRIQRSGTTPDVLETVPDPDLEPAGTGAEDAVLTEVVSGEREDPPPAGGGPLGPAGTGG